MTTWDRRGWVKLLLNLYLFASWGSMLKIAAAYRVGKAASQSGLAVNAHRKRHATNDRTRCYADTLSCIKLHTATEDSSAFEAGGLLSVLPSCKDWRLKIAHWWRYRSPILGRFTSSRILSCLLLSKTVFHIWGGKGCSFFKLFSVATEDNAMLTVVRSCNVLIR